MATFTNSYRNFTNSYFTNLPTASASYFVTHGSAVHAVFLDASKAFGRILHMKLFEKLIQRKVPMCFVRLLKHWFKKQKMQKKWGKHFSEPFHLSNGVRQGGYWVHTCLLFIYMICPMY